MAPHMHLAVLVHAYGKGAAGRDVHSVRLHAFGQLHQAVGGGDVGVHGLAARLGQVCWGNGGTNESEQKQPCQHNHRAGGKGFVKKALDRQLAGAVVPVVLGSPIGTHKETADPGKGSSPFFIFAHLVASSLIY